MYFQVLGPLRVRSSPDGEPVPIAGARQRTILASLLLNANRPVTVRRLVDVVWPFSPPATAREQIQNAIGMLKRRLPAEQIVRHTESYTFHVALPDLDLLQFRQSYDDAVTADEAGDPEQAMFWWRYAVELWRGEVADGVDIDAWHGAIAHLSEQRVRAVCRYAELSLNAPNVPTQLVADLLHWSQLHPVHEGLQMMLARALHRTGRSAEALLALRGYRCQLTRELAVEPGEDVIKLERKLRGEHLVAHQIQRS